MLIKVCGMRSANQVKELNGLVDFIGFIFYPESKRLVQSSPKVDDALKVGVFVNASSEEIEKRIEEESLDVVQLHGAESPETCELLKRKVKVIKAFGVDEDFDFNGIHTFENHVDYFLFDTKTKLHGGSGQQFDWSLLSNYKGSTPFFLSGGINPESFKTIKNFTHPRFAGIDLNSGFENAPGEKDISKLKQFFKELRK